MGTGQLSTTPASARMRTSMSQMKSLTRLRGNMDHAVLRCAVGDNVGLFYIKCDKAEYERTSTVPSPATNGPYTSTHKCKCSQACMQAWGTVVHRMIPRSRRRVQTWPCTPFHSMPHTFCLNLTNVE